MIAEIIGLRKKLPRCCAVYLVYHPYTDELLYVGSTRVLYRRISNGHKAMIYLLSLGINKVKIEWLEHPIDESGGHQLLEKKMIETLKPRLNIRHRKAEPVLRVSIGEERRAGK